MQNDLRPFATFITTQLVNNNLLVNEVNGQWVITKPILGYSGDVSFRTQAEAIDQITRAMLDYYAKHSGLKVAV